MMTGSDLLFLAAFGATVIALLLVAEFGIYLVWLCLGLLKPRRRIQITHLYQKDEKR